MVQILLFWKRNQFVTLRFFTLLTGFIINIACVNYILKQHGDTDFVIFSFISSLPALLNFLDFGLGTAVYNSQVDGSRVSRVKNLALREEKTLIYLFSVCLSLVCIALVLITFFVFPNLFDLAILKNPNQKSLFLYAIILVCITSPFTISYKILLAENKNSQVIVIQGFIPLLTFLIVASGYFFRWTWISLLATPISMLVISVLSYVHSDQFEITKISNISGKMRQISTTLLRHSLLSVIAILLANAVAFLPRYILALNGNEKELVKLSFMTMFLISTQSLISVEAQARVTKIRLTKGFETTLLVRQATYKCLILASILSLGMFSLPLIGDILDLRLISLSEAACASLLLLLWASQIVTSIANSQTKNIKFFILLYSISLLILFFNWKFFEIKSFLQIFCLILLPAYLLAAMIVIGKFKFTIRY